MADLKRYIEWMSRGRRTDRVASVMKEGNLPMPLLAAEWRLDTTFKAAEEILRDPSLETVYKAAPDKDCELVFRQRD
jgi:hypothetical protein